jgi:hypothetical protein
MPKVCWKNFFFPTKGFFRGAPTLCITTLSLMTLSMEMYNDTSCQIDDTCHILTMCISALKS